MSTTFLCLVCGQPNPLGEAYCFACKAPLPRLEEFIPDFEHFLDHEFATQQEVIKEFQYQLWLLHREIESLRQEVYLYRGAFQAIQDILEEKGLLDYDHFNKLWEGHIQDYQWCEEKKAILLKWLPQVMESYNGTQFETLRSYMTRSLIALTEGDGVMAWQWIERLRDLIPDNPSLLSCMGEWLFTEGHHQEALTYLEKGVRDGWTLLLMGLCLLNLNENDRAHQLLEALQNNGVSHYLLYFSLGVIYYRRNELHMATHYLEKALNFHSFPEGHQALASLYLELRKPMKAIQQLERVLNYAPASEETYFLLGFSYLLRGWNRKAQKAFQKALKITPRLEYFQALEVSRYLKHLQKREVSLSPKDLQELHQAEQLLQKGDWSKAYPIFQHLYDRYPQSLRILLGYCLCLLGKKAYAEVSQILEKWLEKQDHPQVALPIFTLYIRALKAQGKGDLIKRSLLFWMEKPIPPFAKALLKIELGEILMENPRELDKAEQLIHEALRDLPEELQARGLDALGWLWYHRGRYKEARHYLQKALEERPEKIFWIHLGMVLLKEGKVEQAREAFQHAEESLESLPAMEHSFLKLLQSVSSGRPR